MTCVEYKTFKLNTFCILYLIVIIDICVSLLLTKLCAVYAGYSGCLGVWLEWGNPKIVKSLDRVILRSSKSYLIVAPC